MPVESMKQKLTLSLERSTIERIKVYAEAKGKSVSQIVGEYFDVLTSEDVEQQMAGRPGRDRPLPEAVQQLIGIAEGTEEEYLRHLEKKHQ